VWACRAVQCFCTFATEPWLFCSFLYDSTFLLRLHSNWIKRLITSISCKLAMAVQRYLPVVDVLHRWLEATSGKTMQKWQ
jgi:hypothetical protein